MLNTVALTLIQAAEAAEAANEPTSKSSMLVVVLFVAIGFGVYKAITRQR